MDASAMKSDTGQCVQPVAEVRPVSGGQPNGILAEDAFHQMICLEKKRTERSGKPFLLLLINLKNFRFFPERSKVFRSLSQVLSSGLRETDVRGWFEYDFILGVIFTEIGETDINRARNRIHQKLQDSLRQHLNLAQTNMLDLSFQVYTGRREEQAVECSLNVQPIEEDPKAREVENQIPRVLNTILRQRCFLFVGDLLLITLAHFLSVWIRLGQFQDVPDVFRGAYTFSILLYPATLYVFDLYNMEKLTSWRWVVFRSILSVMFMTALSAMWFYLVPEYVYGRGILAIQAALVVVMLTGLRMVTRSLLKVSKSKISTLVLGAGESGKSVYELLSDPYSPYKVTAFLDDDPSKQGRVMGSPAVVGTLDKVNEIASRMGAKAAVLALPRNRPVWLTRKILEARLRGIEIIEMPTIYEKLTEKVPVQYIEDQWLLFADGFSLLSKEYVRKIKRVVDFGVATLLLLLTAPLMAFTALAIKLESPGPVFYQQKRVGKGGRVFTVLKFRSMRSDAESSGAQWAKKRDPRVTRVGKWIRVFRIDELPQIWNVFTGDMSLIGPRPERPEFVKELEGQIPYYSVRHTVTPGITGWAQVKYPYGASFEDAIRKLEYDLYYIKNMSVLLDLKIILRTIGVVLLGEGAR